MQKFAVAAGCTRIQIKASRIRKLLGTNCKKMFLSGKMYLDMLTLDIRKFRKIYEGERRKLFIQNHGNFDI